MTFPEIGVRQYVEVFYDQHDHSIFRDPNLEQIFHLCGEHELTEQGLYRHIRHPAYLGELLIFLGIGLAFANRVSLVNLYVFPFIAFSVRINVEEKALLEHFDSRVAAYRKRTWRLVPWVS